MEHRVLRICGMILTIVMVINLLPAQAFVDRVFTADGSASTVELPSVTETLQTSDETEPAPRSPRSG